MFKCIVERRIVISLNRQPIKRITYQRSSPQRPMCTFSIRSVHNDKVLDILNTIKAAINVHNNFNNEMILFHKSKVSELLTGNG